MRLAIVTRLFRRQLALLAAMGASRRSTVAVICLYSTVYLLAGAMFGLFLGLIAAEVLPFEVSRRTGLDLSAQAGVDELLATAGFPASRGRSHC